MEKTIQKKVFDELKQIDNVKLGDIAEKIGITKVSMSDRMRHNITLKNFWEMLQVCGYDIVISKAPENREPSISVGKADCDCCVYKNRFLDIENSIAAARRKIDEEAAADTDEK